jgi:hypothetical protein
MPIDDDVLRAWRWARQGLDGSLQGRPAAQVLERSGWARSVAGAGPYLTLFARSGISREDADRAVARLEIHELPAARGCTYVVPESDFALALRAGEGFDSDLKTAYRLGVTEKEIEKLCDAVSGALKHGALDPDGLREAVGGAARNLGPEGAKKGVTTTLPLALGELQRRGAIRRVPVNGRLDQQRYRYTLWQPNPLAQFRLSKEEVLTEVARRYFRWIGPATIGEFQWFSGLGVKAAKAAVAPLGLASLEGERLMFADDLDALRSFKAPKKACHALVSSLDALFLLRRNLRDTVAADAWKRVFPNGGLTDLPSHAIVERGRLAGLWEFDSQAGSIVRLTFAPEGKSLDAAIQATESYVRDQLGDARTFSLDSPKSRVPRLEALRAGRLPSA